MDENHLNPCHVMGCSRAATVSVRFGGETSPRRYCAPCAEAADRQVLQPKLVTPDDPADASGSDTFSMTWNEYVDVNGARTEVPQQQRGGLGRGENSGDTLPTEHARVDRRRKRAEMRPRELTLLMGTLLAISSAGCGGDSTQPYCFADEGLWSCYASQATCEAKRDDANKGGMATPPTPCRRAKKLSCFTAGDSPTDEGFSVCGPTYEACVTVRDTLIADSRNDNALDVRSQCEAGALPADILNITGSVELAKMEAKHLACDAYTNWRRKARKQCPPSIEPLAAFTNMKDLADPWGNDYVLLCGDQKPKAAGVCIGVVSSGPDGKPDTDDDVRSWNEDE